jgi:hypothetical protein
MKRFFSNTATATVLMMVSLLFTGCLKDQCSNTFTMYKPIYKSLTQVRADMKSGQSEPLKNTGKLYLYGQYVFLNEIGAGIHVIDNSNPAQPKNISFIKVPGNMDLAVKDNYLYADSYSDLVVFDVANPANITAKKFVNNVFPQNNAFYWNNGSNDPDSIQVVVGFTAKDTTINCETYTYWNNCASCALEDASGNRFYSAAAAAPVKGMGGSMARFSIAQNFLYTVTYSRLHAFDINNAVDPVLTSQKDIGWNIETIYPFKDKLFIGSTTGMFIYDMVNASNPTLLGQFSHVRSCDPVIADDNYAYVTLRSGTQCQGFADQMEVLDISNLSNPVLKKTYALTNPHGLSKDGDLLFICDGAAGLKVYDAADVNNIKRIKTFEGIETYDVIANSGIALVVAKDGLYQFDYSDANDIRQISKINITK